ncbi:MAG: hypothetical protein JSV65_05295 [Armatimonadota bacterium]|nr:MAG: hypothetical protein JSV65_05295 [Armatimonadota bacterium]
MSDKSGIWDEPSVQEFRTLFTRFDGLPSNEVRDLALTADGTVWAATAAGLARFDGKLWERIWVAGALAGANVGRLAAGRDGDLWVGGSTGVSLLREGQWRHWWGYESPTRWIHDLAPDDNGGVWAVMSHEGDLATRDVWHLVGDTWQFWQVGAARDISGIALDGAGRPHVVSDGALLTLDRDQWQAVDLGGAEVLGASAAPDGSVWVGTSDDVIVLREGAIAERIGKAEGLPVAGVRKVAFGPDGDVWLTHSTAVSRRTTTGWRYYSPDTWVPGDGANAIALASDGTVWMAGSQGVARIESSSMTLADKAQPLDSLTPALHMRDGFLCDVAYAVPNDPDSPRHFHISDNDGLWTAEYVASQCFRYAVTRAPEAKAHARAGLEALMRLVEVTGLPGFFARAMYRLDDETVAAVAGEWHLSSDGQWVWKGDTSSDEMDGHMFAYGVYYDLAADEQERERISALVSRLVGGIIDNDYILQDTDGKHTRWGVWSPSLLNESPEWQAQQKLNSLEILSHVRTALHITGEQRFRDAYRELVETHGYAENVRREQMATPIDAFHKFDDDLAMLAYYPLIQYEDDPGLREIYLDSLARFWEFVRPEVNPLHVFMCNALLCRKEGLEPAVEVLRGYRMDHASRAVVNEVRQDVEWRQVGRRRLLVKPLPGAERAAYHSNQNMYASERRASPGRMRMPTPFLWTYWLARYHGLISGPADGR